jgi:hypothetical protein
MEAYSVSGTISIYDKSDQMDLVQRVCKELNINDELYPVNSLQTGSRTENRMITPDEFAETSKGFVWMIRHEGLQALSGKTCKPARNGF